MRIGEVAARSGVNSSAIRYYESVGVLPEPERVAGRRRYDEGVLRALSAIETAQRAGFSLEEIRPLLRAAETESAAAKLRELATRKLADVEALIAEGEAMRTWLRAAQSCECPTLDVCALFEPPAAAGSPAGAQEAPSPPASHPESGSGGSPS
jgi:MerR family transcriptional regulator, redox-sensitive transcriptional activator SoxR